jgi:hypothetical protein
MSGLPAICLASFMSVLVKEPHSTSPGSTEPLRKNSNLITIIGVRPAGVCPLRRGVPRDDCMIVIHQKRFAAVAVDAMVLPSIVGERLQIDSHRRVFGVCDP